jgi:hypothetical protein
MTPLEFMVLTFAASVGAGILGAVLGLGGRVERTAFPGRPGLPV